jgi:hypothetical protein
MLNLMFLEHLNTGECPDVSGEDLWDQTLRAVLLEILAPTLDTPKLTEPYVEITVTLCIAALGSVYTAEEVKAGIAALHNEGIISVIPRVERVENVPQVRFQLSLRKSPPYYHPA